MQDCSNSSALAMELLQSCTKPSIYSCVKKAHTNETKKGWCACTFCTPYSARNSDYNVKHKTVLINSVRQICTPKKRIKSYQILIPSYLNHMWIRLWDAILNLYVIAIPFLPMPKQTVHRIDLALVGGEIFYGARQMWLADTLFYLYSIIEYRVSPLYSIEVFLMLVNHKDLVTIWLNEVVQK